nr:immunoglobulin light chain junction region [Macaca mulatta]MOW40449.1 immunoglobulin light chain junction region [Macaca mulatta]
CQQETKWSLSF